MTVPKLTSEIQPIVHLSWIKASTYLFVLLVINLNIMPWNATGLISSASYLCDALKDKVVDICGISEHFLFPNNVHFLDNLNSDYCYHVSCDKDLSIPSKRRVVKRDVCLMWHTQYNNDVVPLSIDDRIVGIQLQTTLCQFMFIFQLYLPCSNYHMHTYREYMDKVYDVWYSYSGSGTVLFI